jgi:flagellar hook-associated protein 1 FlgK
MNGIYTIGLQSLMAYQSAMNTVSQNIANQRTAYYSRKVVDFSEGIAGSGVSIGDVRRIYDESTSQNVQQSTSNFSAMDLYLRNMKYFEPLLDQDSTNVAKYLNDAIASLTSLNADTSIYDNRVGYLDKLGQLCTQFNSVSTQIEAQYTNINQQLQSTIVSINDTVSSIAALNAQIVAIPDGQDPSNLQDQREQLVQGLAKYLNCSSSIGSDGQMNLTLSNGTPLLAGSSPTLLSTATDAAYPQNIDVILSNGSKSISINGLLTSGQIGGLLNYRQSLYTAQQALGRVSLAISQTMNSQNKLGMDYNGALGGNIFNDVNGTSACLSRVIPNQNNTGTANLNVSITSVPALMASDYKLQFDTASHYTLTRISDGTVMSSGALGSLPQSISADGFSINIASGSVQAGDQFMIAPTANSIGQMGLAISDPKLLALGWPVTANASTANHGDGSVNLTAMLDTTNVAFSTPHALNPPLRIEFLSDSTYQLVNANTNTVMEGPLNYTSGDNVFPTPGGYDPGYRVTLAGGIKSGDVFNIDYNSNGASDNSNGRAMAAIYSNGCLAGSSLNFMQAYRSLSGDVSRQVNDAQQKYTSYQALQRQAVDQFNEISAVNTSEEGVMLMSYQEAYQASAQILQVARTIFDSVLGMMR